MAFTSWRGVVGCIKPTLRPGGLEELIRILPDGIGVLPLFLNIREGTTEEFKRARSCYVCKQPHTKVHHFYDGMCPACADLNYAKRFQTADLSGRSALITGARLKIVGMS